LVTAAYLATEASFGLVLPISYQMNMAVGILAGGLVALSKPKPAPVGAGVAAFLAFDTFFFSYYDPLWGLVTFVGAILCVAGWGLTLFGSRSETTRSTV
jgi:hypothetical protein